MSLQPLAAMDAGSSRFFTDRVFSGDAFAPPPGLEDCATPPMSYFIAGSFGTVQGDAESQPGSTGVEVRKFCVHCGTKVAEKLLKMKHVKFCVCCGKQHPEHFMDMANSPVKVEDVNEEVADFISLKQKVETLKSVDMITQLIAMCDAQLVPRTVQNQYGQQQFPRSEVFGVQCRQSDSSWGQHAGSTYGYTSHSPWNAAQF